MQPRHDWDRAGQSVIWRAGEGRCSRSLQAILSEFRICSGRSATTVSGTRCGTAHVLVAGNHPWPGDPMQSFKVLLHHRAASMPGGVLIGMFWTDPNEIDRSFPIKALGELPHLDDWEVGPFAACCRWCNELLARLDHQRPSCCIGRVSLWSTELS